LIRERCQRELATLSPIGIAAAAANQRQPDSRSSPSRDGRPELIKDPSSIAPRTADIVVAVLFVVTDHAAERFLQRVRGTLDAKTEIAARAARAHAAGRTEPGTRGTVLIRDLQRRDLVYVCRPELDQLVVVTLWEEDDQAAVPRRFTDALRRA
jgi:hypothetical protein